MNFALIVMAAGSGTRYGRYKQIEPIGPNGETIVDYSLFDAARYGFRKVVFVVRREIEESFRTAIGRRINEQFDVCYVVQNEVAAVAPPTVPDRMKPWGTAHAVLSTIDVVHEPFAVINADDYYGRDSFRVVSEHFRSGYKDASLVGFSLRNTLSEFGPVKRGLCIVSNAMLQSVMEAEQVEIDGRAVKYVDADGINQQLTGDEIVSMNMWGFHPTIFKSLYGKWIEFVDEVGNSKIAELYLPSVITDLIREHKATCRVLQSSGSWFGLTYPNDLSLAVNRIQELILQGVYPEELWSS